MKMFDVQTKYHMARKGSSPTNLMPRDKTLREQWNRIALVCATSSASPLMVNFWLARLIAFLEKNRWKIFSEIQNKQSENKKAYFRENK